MKLTCSNCGEYKEPDRVWGYRYCNKCHAAWNRSKRPKHSQLDDEQRKKANCRSYAGVYVRGGRIKKKPCSKCGNPNAEMHHNDYTKPLKVKWLCRVCHLAIHGIKKMKME